PNKLSKIQESLNTTKQSSTGFTPSRLLFGIERGPGDALHIEAELPDTQEKVDVVSDREIAAERLLKNAEKQNIRFDKKRRTNVEFKRDDTVGTLQFSGKRFVSISIAGEHSGVPCCVHEWFGLEPETMWIHLRRLSITNCVALVVWLCGPETTGTWGHLTSVGK
ncbi:hypothetical protein KPH14_012035, partial [Odynerus spinipes]